MSGYFYVEKSNVKDIYFKRKKLPDNSGFSSLQSFMSIGPEKISVEARERLIGIVRRISEEFNIESSPFLIQANIDGDDINVIEFAARVSGGLAFREIEILTGFDLIESVICSYLGESVCFESANKADGNISNIHLYGEKGNLSHVEGMSDLIADGVVEEFYMHKTPGMEMSCSDFSSRNRVLGAIIRFESEKNLEAKIRTMLDRLSVINSDGLDVLVRDVFN